MRAGVLSAGLWSVVAGGRTAESEDASSPVRSVPPSQTWDPVRFAQEQLRGLVRQVFCSNAAPLRQVVFSAVEPETEVHSICMNVGQILALETLREVAVVGQSRPGECGESAHKQRNTPLRQIATRVQENLWLVPAHETDEVAGTTISLHTYLGEIRQQFEYSIVEAVPCGASNEAAAMAQFADGMVLVLSAQRTRRAAAREIREALSAAQVRLLGTVLSDREFPIPDGIYRRL